MQCLVLGDLNNTEKLRTINGNMYNSTKYFKDRCLITLPSSKHMTGAVRSDWFKSLVYSGLKAVYDCWIAKLPRKFKKLSPSDRVRIGRVS